MKRTSLGRVGVALFLLLVGSAWPAGGLAPRHDGAPAAQNVILITLDGLRWQEVLHGAEERMMTREQGHVSNVDDLRRHFWRDTAEARREALMPFL
jgi:hypothetical protein